MAFRLLSRGSSRRRRRGPRRKSTSMSGFRGSVRLSEARSEEHTSELQSLMRSPYAVFCLKKKHKHTIRTSLGSPQIRLTHLDTQTTDNSHKARTHAQKYRQPAPLVPIT